MAIYEYIHISVYQGKRNKFWDTTYYHIGKM